MCALYNSICAMRTITVIEPVVDMAYPVSISMVKLISCCHWLVYDNHTAKWLTHKLQTLMHKLPCHLSKAAFTQR